MSSTIFGTCSFQFIRPPYYFPGYKNTHISSCQKMFRPHPILAYINHWSFLKTSYCRSRHSFFQFPNLKNVVRIAGSTGKPSPFLWGNVPPRSIQFSHINLSWYLPPPHRDKGDLIIQAMFPIFILQNTGGITRSRNGKGNELYSCLLNMSSAC